MQQGRAVRTSQVTKVEGDDGWGAPHVMPAGGSVGIPFVSCTLGCHVTCTCVSRTLPSGAFEYVACNLLLDVPNHTATIARRAK